MPTYYSAHTYFVATFRVQCELCRQPFAFEQEFCGSSGLWEASPGYAREKANASAEGQKARLQTGDYSSVESQECPRCGYIQSWMLKRAKGNRYFNHFLGWGALLAIGLMFGLLLLADWLSERPPPPFYMPWAILGVTAAGSIGLVISIRRHHQFDPNAEVLRGRPAPAETGSPRISFRPGRKAH
jgi:hypothetical protein